MYLYSIKDIINSVEPFAVTFNLWYPLIAFIGAVIVFSYKRLKKYKRTKINNVICDSTTTIEQNKLFNKILFYTGPILLFLFIPSVFFLLLGGLVFYLDEILRIFTNQYARTFLYMFIALFLQCGIFYLLYKIIPSIYKGSFIFLGIGILIYLMSITIPVIFINQLDVFNWFFVVINFIINSIPVFYIEYVRK